MMTEPGDSTPKTLFARAGERLLTRALAVRSAIKRYPLLDGPVRKCIRVWRSTIRFIGRRRSLIVLRCGVLPGLVRGKNPGKLRMPVTDLVARARRFWFDNERGVLEVAGHAVTRRDIYEYGGPNPHLVHPVSQRMEWLSRIAQRNLYEPHESPQSEECRVLCERQGDEQWTHQHQNFDFAVGCDPGLRAPRCLCILPSHGSECWVNTYDLFQRPRCDQWMLVLKRRLARSCQIDVVDHPAGTDWSRYDLVFVPNTGRNVRFGRPDVPVVLYGHDMWPEDAGYQWVIDWLEPDILLVTSPSPWRENFRLSQRTRIVFSPFAPSLFFTRSNPDPARKELDLLVIGRTRWSVYAPRVALTDQIRPLAGRYRIEFSHHTGARRFSIDGGTLHEGADGPVRFLNRWSEYLGSARYVVFGRHASRVHRFVLGKHYEALASGAVPIFPEVPDLELLGVRPFEHYIPLSEVEGDNERLAFFLDRYNEFHYIARNAVDWSAANMDRMLFDGFEATVHELTGGCYPRRLLDS